MDWMCWIFFFQLVPWQLSAGAVQWWTVCFVLFGFSEPLENRLALLSVSVRVLFCFMETPERMVCFQFIFLLGGNNGESCCWHVPGTVMNSYLYRIYLMLLITLLWSRHCYLLLFKYGEGERQRLSHLPNLTKFVAGRVHAQDTQLPSLGAFASWLFWEAWALPGRGASMDSSALDAKAFC